VFFFGKPSVFDVPSLFTSFFCQFFRISDAFPKLVAFFVAFLEYTTIVNQLVRQKRIGIHKTPVQRIMHINDNLHHIF